MPLPYSFQGTYTALITPFLSNGEVDYQALERLVEEQILANIDGIVVIGTTGESPTLSWEEHDAVIRFIIQKAKKRTKIIAGTGSNATHEALEHSKIAEQNGADALLVVSPYYNKPTQQGLYEYFTEICKSVSIPIIAYNIQGRCGVNIETKTLLRIREENQNFIGVKEASGNISQMMEVLSTLPKDFLVLSGDDALTVPLLSLGGHGVISVLSNALPEAVKEMVDAGLRGDFSIAREKHFSLLQKIQACFIETNPIPIKTLLASMGKCQEVFRSPLCKMLPENKKKLLTAFGREDTL